MKIGRKMKGGSRVAIWLKKMDKTSHTIVEHLLANEGTLEIINRGIQNIEAFMGEDFEVTIATHVQTVFPLSTK